jgi:hypothetical protein
MSARTPHATESSQLLTTHVGHPGSLRLLSKPAIRQSSSNIDRKAVETSRFKSTRTPGANEKYLSFVDGVNHADERIA